MFILFGGIDYYITEVQYSILEEASDFYISKMKFQGTLQNTDRIKIIDELEAKGFKNIIIKAKDGYDNELNNDYIIVRDTEDIVSSALHLEIIAEPKAMPFMFGRLLGVKEDKDFYFKVTRRAISEKPRYEI